MTHPLVNDEEQFDRSAEHPVVALETSKPRGTVGPGYPEQGVHVLSDFESARPIRLPEIRRVHGPLGGLLGASGGVNSPCKLDDGGTLGAGIEFSFAPNWSAAIEYNHLFIPNNNTNFVTPAGVVISADRIHGDADLVSVRVNYRWGGPVVAKY